jgi:hypothetical protein
LKIYFGVPQGFAQLLSEEGVCVAFYAVRPMERGSMAVGDFSTLWRSCIGPPSQPKLASSLPNKRLSYCRLTGCARNGRGRVHWSFFDKYFKRGCKKEGLMQYKCMEKKIRKLHGRILFQSAMYIANIPAGMQL